MLDQMRSIDKSRLGGKIGSLSIREMQEIDLILKFLLALQSKNLTIPRYSRIRVCSRVGSLLTQDGWNAVFLRLGIKSNQRE